MTLLRAGAILATVLALVACGGEPRPAAETLDASLAPVADCEFRTMIDAMDKIPTVAGTDAGAICSDLTRRLGGPPPMRVLRAVAKSASMISIFETEAGREVDVVPVAKTIGEIIQVRGQTDPEAMYATADLVVRMYTGTNGEVRPSRLLRFLKDSGPMAKTLSDEGLTNMVTLIRNG